MATTQISWKSKDGLKLYARAWTSEQAKGVVALVHGMGEHIDRYDHLANYFNAAGFSVLGFDHRGHGQSEGKRGHTPNFEAYLDDVEVLLTQTRTRFPNLPIFLYGHSMGGNVVLNYLLRRKPEIQAVITTGPWIKLAFEPNAALVMVGKLLRNIVPGFTQDSGLNPQHIARRAATVEAYKKDPLVHGKISSAAGIDLMKSGQWLLAQKGTLPVPTLIQHGADDQITSAAASRQFSAQFEGTTYKTWEGLYHEIHNEDMREEVYQYTLDWMKKQG